MSRYLAACLVCMWFLVACSMFKTADRRAALEGARLTLCKSVESKDEIVLPREAARTFSPYDRQVVAHLALENFSGDAKIRWVWIDPSGDRYHTSKNAHLRTSSGKYVQRATVSHTLSIDGEPAAARPGDWKVIVEVDGKPFRSAVFSILDPSMVVPPMHGPGVAVSQNRWGVIIGIEKYDHLPSAPYAGNDADKMAVYFEKILGVPPKNTLIQRDASATKSKIEAATRSWLRKNVGRSGTVYFYFSGHGAPDETTGEPYLVPYDVDPRIGNTGYPIQTLMEDLEDLHARHTFVFLDACFSGQARGSTEMLVPVKAVMPLQKKLNLSSSTMVVLSASSKNQASTILEAAQHGLFTFYLLRAMSGDADTNGNQLVSVAETYHFVRENVADAARLKGRVQTPDITPSLEKLKEINLCKVAGHLS
jgi:hypothetical protein